MMNNSMKTQIALLAGLLVIPVVGASIGCDVDDADDLDNVADSEALEESRAEAGDPGDPDPGEGTGDASWTISSNEGTAVFIASINDGVADEPLVVGTLPSFRELPMTVVNGDGEVLTIDEIVIDGVSHHQLIGTYDILADSAQSAAGCTECSCAFGGGPPCMDALSWTNCSSTASSCNVWSCGGGGGGVVTLELTVTATPGAS